ncbi:Winged helix-turn-helix DNA-binding domain [Nostoc flagelliforme CCNUN1]|uniref:Winged helix-turn-helix DNA-binding domain n=1 Tax=Nostoc flagelliforme CCNUN1 TaxID=2038116 RepID=A0A2K8SL42_9NOSO|nr:hypothetical protein [Nostoc flagelliforme]AUB36162.1 Winged helix-turn-helix DNA-binding domain [Nostoc flagelliforme CCNUN1]
MFYSFVLGEVSHPVNVLKEFLAVFPKRQKVKASILSYIDGWHVTGHEWVRVTVNQLAQHLGYCAETISRHMAELVDEKLVERSFAKWWHCDRSYQYRINRAELIVALGGSPIPQKSDHGCLDLPDINTNLESDLKDLNTELVQEKKKELGDEEQENAVDELDDEAIKRLIAESPFMQEEPELEEQPHSPEILEPEIPKVFDVLKEAETKAINFDALERLRHVGVPLTKQIRNYLSDKFKIAIDGYQPDNSGYTTLENIAALEEEAAVKGLNDPLKSFWAAVKSSWRPRHDVKRWWEAAAAAFGTEKRDRLIKHGVGEIGGQPMVRFDLAHGLVFPLELAWRMSWVEIEDLATQLITKE